MDEDDLPPEPATEGDGGFSGALGRTLGLFIGIALLVAVAAGILLLIRHGL